MSDRLLLAASLITVGQGVAPPPSILPIAPDHLSTLLASTLAQTLQANNTPQFVPVLDLALPEFSQSQPELASTQIQSPPDLVPSQLLKNWQALPLPQSAAAPSSGTELYYQRVAALKRGKTYINLATNSFQTILAKQVSAQVLPKPTHQQWIRLLEQEAKAIAKGQGNNRLGILVGDSLSMWFPASGLPGGQLWLNQGISGENSTQILNRLSALNVTRPDTIYVMAGTNDLRQGASDQVILDNIREMVSQLRQNHPQAQIVMQSILPTRLSDLKSDSELVARFHSSRISKLNQQIAAIAKQAGAGYLNLNALFADSQGQMRQDLTTDGIHLSRRGYEVWQDALHYAESVMSVNRVAKK